jgi:hypothetical protein
MSNSTLLAIVVVILTTVGCGGSQTSSVPASGVAGISVEKAIALAEAAYSQSGAVGPFESRLQKCDATGYRITVETVPRKIGQHCTVVISPSGEVVAFYGGR